jgi:hypothetical protein
MVKTLRKTKKQIKLEKEEEILKLDNKIKLLLSKREDNIIEIKILLFKFTSYYNKIDSLDKLGLLEIGEKREATGYTFKNIDEFDNRFKEILDIENNIRELKQIKASL